MPRTLPSVISSGIAQAITTPGYLIQIDTSITLRYSTRGTVPYDSDTWIGGARVDSLDLGAGTGRIAIPNADDAAGALILANALSEVAVTIWAFAEAEPTDVVQVFSGVIDAAEEIGELECVLSLAPTTGARSSIPDIVIGPPLCNHLLPAGTVITWGNTTFTIESA